MKGSRTTQALFRCPTQIVARVPRLRELSKLRTQDLSKKAEFRLEVFDWFFRQSENFSLTGTPDAAYACHASATCRHFGIHRSIFYRWKKRYDKQNLSSLENKSTEPNKKRKPEYSRELIEKVRDIRKSNPTYSGKKIKAIFEREKIDAPSAATISRLISREKLFFRADVNRHRNRSKAALKAHERVRKPANLKADAGGQIIEFDMKHIYLLGQKHYAFCAIDPFTKEALVHSACMPPPPRRQVKPQKRHWKKL